MCAQHGSAAAASVAADLNQHGNASAQRLASIPEIVLLHRPRKQKPRRIAPAGFFG
jgi:hypothetical protein